MCWNLKHVLLVVDVQMITKIRPKRDVRSRFHSLCETDPNSITSLGLEPKSDIMLKLDNNKIILTVASDGRNDNHIEIEH
jgi:hypothetical protein